MAKKKGLSESNKDNIAAGIGLGGIAAYYTSPHHADWAHNAKMAGVRAKHTAKYSRPVLSKSGAGVKRYGSHHWATSTHGVTFHKSAHMIYQSSTATRFGKHDGFATHSHTHTTHSISAPVAIGGAAAVAGGAYYWRKRKNGQRSRVKKGVRK